MDDFQAHPLWAQSVCQGKQALKKEHRALVLESKQHKVVQSLDFDACLKNLHLEHKRWDYMVEIHASKTLAFEVNAYDPKGLLDKKNGTLAILQSEFAQSPPKVDAWHVAVLVALPRQDLLARFRAETQIHIQRQLDLSKV